MTRPVRVIRFSLQADVLNGVEERRVVINWLSYGHSFGIWEGSLGIVSAVKVETRWPNAQQPPVALFREFDAPVPEARAVGRVIVLRHPQSISEVSNQPTPPS